MFHRSGDSCPDRVSRYRSTGCPRRAPRRSVPRAVSQRVIALSRVLLQPGNDACRDLVRGLAAHVHADVPGVDAAAGVIGAAEVALHGRRGIRRDDVIPERVEIEHWLADLAQIPSKGSDAEPPPSPE